MAYVLEVDPGRRRVSFEVTGTFRSEEMLQLIHEMLAHPDFRAGFDALVDLTAVDEVPLSSVDIRKKVDLDRDLASKVGAARWAIVATQDVVYGLARMFQILMDDTPIEVKTFREVGAAESWLEQR